ncbi:pyruvate formate-lyase-activating protein [Demequina activiva]|uniref:Pyruvate formate-lyase-activating enzyme n=1 Tax=Demequina activiva TaxID=1582364 RepID=A0A919UIL3_9MICO|nr:pyruvate formate-lyase-activating protein [Demequina activiva]GIG53501.1 pyruvate formate-lyase-activating enzyme [Demequina activiva]
MSVPTATSPGATPDIDCADQELRASLRNPGETGSIHSWELVTAVDGPGTRLTYFLAGCPLRCLYCQNPDTWQMRRGERQSVEQVARRIERYAHVLRTTGGGVTLSGGEPLLQAPFVEAIFEECKRMGVHTALDTSGFLGARASNRLLANTDLVLLDVKSGDPETYRKVTGRPLQPTLDFGERLSAQGIPIWMRYVLVPGLTDDEQSIQKVVEYARSLSSLERVEVLPFHQMGREKWRALNEPYALEDTEPPSPQLVARVRRQFARAGLAVY